MTLKEFKIWLDGAPKEWDNLPVALGWTCDPIGGLSVISCFEYGVDRKYVCFETAADIEDNQYSYLTPAGKDSIANEDKDDYEFEEDDESVDEKALDMDPDQLNY